MEAQELAKLLNGRHYRKEISKAEAEQAKEDGLVVVFGVSDDLMEFRGATYDEEYVLDGHTDTYLDKEGTLKPVEDEIPTEFLERYQLLKTFNEMFPNKITAVWNGRDANEPSWRYVTDIPHHTFDITEQDDPGNWYLYCKGIVFNLKDLK